MKRLLAAIVGIVLACLSLPVRAEEWTSCRTEGYLSHFDPRLTAQPCDVVATITIPYRSHSITLRAIHRRSSPMAGDAAFLDNMREAAAEIGAAMNQMGPGLRLGDVTVLYTNMLSAAGSDGRDQFLRGDIQAWTSSPGPPVDSSHPGATRECSITYFKGVGRGTEANLAFTLAHEVFHCIQFNTWPAMPRDKWLIEGSAEYFAYLARPTGSGDEGFIRDFDQRIVAQPLSALDYPAVVFFLWYGGLNGPQAFHAFVRDTRSLQGAINADQWFKFAQDYEDRQIVYPDGRPLASRPVPGRTMTISGSADFVKPSAPYTINTYTYAFARGKVFELTYSEMPEDGREAWRKLDGAAWANPPSNVTTCDGEKQYRVLWTTVRSNTAGRTRITGRPASAAECTCPVGQWQETRESTRRFFEQSALAAFSHTSKRLRGGTRTLVLNPDHTGSFSYNAIDVVAGEGTEMVTETLDTGTNQFSWKTANGMLFTVLKAGSNRMQHQSTTTIQGRVSRMTVITGLQSIGHYFHCDSEGLHLVQHARVAVPGIGVPSFNVDMDFQRVGGP